MSGKVLGSRRTARISPVFRWLGLTLVCLLFLEIGSLLIGGELSNQSSQHLAVERIVDQASMGFLGLMMMVLSLRFDNSHTKPERFRLLVGVLSISIAFVLLYVMTLAFSGNRSFAKTTNQFLQQKQIQLEALQIQRRSPEALADLGDQLVFAGQLSPAATSLEKQKAAQLFLTSQLRETNEQIKAGVSRRNIALNQRHLVGTLSAMVLFAGFLGLAFISLTMKFS